MKSQKFFKIGKRKIGPGNPCYIIFEVASTHENDWNIAKKYVDQAKKTGADALKFQLYTADKLLNPIASILKPTYDYFKTAETPRDWFPKLLELCKKADIDLLCTPFDKNSASFLNRLELPAVKIASGDLTNHQLLLHVAKFGKPIILSTGMAIMDEVKQAVSILKKSGCRELTLLQCASVYPMPYEDANVRAMLSLQKEFGCVVGYSDNGSESHLVPLLAVALGASIIEKHVTSQKQRGSLDDQFSMTVSEFSEMVRRIRRLEKVYKGSFERVISDLKKEFGKDVGKALGDGVKKPAELGISRADGTRMTETDERHWARRGLYPKINISKGSTVTENMLISLRPDIGISAPSLQNIIGKIAAEDLLPILPIKLEEGKIKMFRRSDIQKTYTNPRDLQFAKILQETALFD